MGLFSFMYADTGNKENLCIGESAYVLLPDKEPIFEASYDGYGHFGGADVYEVAFELNRGLITEKFLDSCRCTPRNYDRRIIHWTLEGKTDQEITNLIKQQCDNDCFIREWKREVGITLSCYDEDNERLPFPIKITKQPCEYRLVPASKGDPEQGCGKHIDGFPGDDLTI